MLTSQERLKLIRQIEKSNLTNEQSEQLIKWAEEMLSKKSQAEHILVACDVLDMIFSGVMDICDFRNGEPIVRLSFMDHPHEITPQSIVDYNEDEEEDDDDEEEEDDVSD